LSDLAELAAAEECDVATFASRLAEPVGVCPLSSGP
jgi:hypothetical protein